MGICNVLAVVPFLCAGAVEEPEQEQEEEVVGHVIEAQPAPEVELGVLDAPGEGSVRPLAEYQVLPPSTAYRDSLTEEEIEAAQEELFATEQPATFGDWVGQNYAGQQEVQTPPTLASREPTPEIRTELRSPVVVATSTPTAAPTVTATPAPVRTQPVHQEPVVVATVTPEPVVVEPAYQEPVVTAAVNPTPVTTQPVTRQPTIAEPTVQANEVDLATLYTPANPAPEAVRQPAPAVRQAAMNLGPRATTMSAIKAEEAQEIRATEVVFTEPEPFTERGQSVLAEGIAQRKRQRFRSAMREYRRELRRAGQDS